MNNQSNESLFCSLVLYTFNKVTEHGLMHEALMFKRRQNDASRAVDVLTRCIPLNVIVVSLMSVSGRLREHSESLILMLSYMRQFKAQRAKTTNLDRVCIDTLFLLAFIPKVLKDQHCQ